MLTIQNFFKKTNNCDGVGWGPLPYIKMGATTLQLMKDLVLLESSWVGLIGTHREVWDLFTGVYLRLGQGRLV